MPRYTRNPRYDVRMHQIERKKLQEAGWAGTAQGFLTFCGSGTTGRSICQGLHAQQHADGSRHRARTCVCTHALLLGDRAASGAEHRITHVFIRVRLTMEYRVIRQTLQHAKTASFVQIWHDVFYMKLRAKTQTNVANTPRRIDL